MMRVAEKIDAGTVFINCYNKTDVAAPFGGFKQSGFGKDLGTLFALLCFNFVNLDLGEEALHEYLKTKNDYDRILSETSNYRKRFSYNRSSHSSSQLYTPIGSLYICD